MLAFYVNCGRVFTVRGMGSIPISENYSLEVERHKTGDATCQRISLRGVNALDTSLRSGWKSRKALALLSLLATSPIVCKRGKGFARIGQQVWQNVTRVSGVAFNDRPRTQGYSRIRPTMTLT